MLSFLAELTTEAIQKISRTLRSTGHYLGRQGLLTVFGLSRNSKLLMSEATPKPRTRPYRFSTGEALQQDIEPQKASLVDA